MNDIVGIPDSAPSAAFQATTGGGKSPNPPPTLDGVEAHRRQALLNSVEAFDRELSAMPGEWVAFAGSTRLGYANTRVALIRACMNQVQIQEWVFDLGFTAHAFGWR